MKHIIFLASLFATIAATAAPAKNFEEYLVKVNPHYKSQMKFQMQSFGAESKFTDIGFNDWVKVTVPVSARSMNKINLMAMEGVEFVQPNYKLHMLENPAIANLRAVIAKYYRPFEGQADCPFPEEYKDLCGAMGGGAGAGNGGGGTQDCPFPEEYKDLCGAMGGGAGGGGGGFPDPGDGGAGAGGSTGSTTTLKDNPAIPEFKGGEKIGADPLFSSQWGMNDIGVKEAWNITRGSEDVIVAVIDTGVDYTHEDLMANLWRNPNEIPDNGIDDDKNGYIDDVIGWDFFSKDNKPFDLQGNVMNGGNPGHGTHCSGNVAARGDNSIGISGVAPNVKLMALRFISDKGEGTTEDAILAIKYAVDNGARVLSNSWGSEGDDPSDATGNKALKDAITYAASHNVLFVAAAGNGRSANPGMTPAVGYNNDTDSKPGVPATYDNDNIVSVAAIDSANKLASFSNFGKKTVDLAAPGVKVFSTIVGGKYSDTVIKGMATWDGTSMATPHVAGAAALYWSAHPNATYADVKDALIKSAAPVSSLSSKMVSGGKLDVKALMQH